jgi:hypothetical protein
VPSDDLSSGTVEAVARDGTDPIAGAVRVASAPDPDVWNVTAYVQAADYY